LNLLIAVNNLTYIYKSGSSSEVKALDSINMQVNEGEVLAITGQNGSGKSTLARHFNGLLAPLKGEVLVGGLSVADKPNIPLIRRMVGMVFQNPDNQLVSSVVEEDIAFGPENLGLSQGVIRERVNWALETLNIQNLRHASPNRLSEGQKQLVAIAGVLAMKPRCIVLDEPTAHLDPRGKREVIESVLRLNREENITIVLLTHFMDEAVLCDRMIVMDQGEVKLQGSPREIFCSSDKIISLGLDFPIAYRLAAGLREKGFQLPPDIIQTEEFVNYLCRL
jgi:energy-coupling factor transport system ATP-binding protein